MVSDIKQLMVMPFRFIIASRTNRSVLIEKTEAIMFP